MDSRQRWGLNEQMGICMPFNHWAHASVYCVGVVYAILVCSTGVGYALGHLHERCSNLVFFYYLGMVLLHEQPLYKARDMIPARIYSMSWIRVSPRSLTWPCTDQTLSSVLHFQIPASLLRSPLRSQIHLPPALHTLLCMSIDRHISKIQLSTHTPTRAERRRAVDA